MEDQTDDSGQPVGAAIVWKRDTEFGGWAATLDGRTIARCQVSDRVRPGYYGRYTGRIYAVTTKTETLTRFKELTRQAADERARA